ncbi:MAG: DUF6059 family protein [Actinoplanes sp.]
MVARRSRWRRAWRLVGRAIVLGLQHYGASQVGMRLPAPPPPSGVREPPAGHPERLAAGLPPTSAESQLWAQLGYHLGP